MKSLKNFICAFALVAMVFGAVGCIPETPVPKEYTVTYVTDYGTAPEAKKVFENTKLTAEYLPELSFEGYKFIGWKIGDVLIKVNEYEVKSDITLVAKWEKVTLPETEGEESSGETEDSEKPENPPSDSPDDEEINPFANIKQVNGMPIISITANYLATSKEDGYVEKNVNDFVKLPVAKSVKEQEKGWNGTAYANDPVPFYKESTISVLDENGNVTLKEVEGQVKVRGNWTTTYKKKPLRIKFDKKQSMLGLNEGNEFKNWVLLASFKDRSFLRDITGYTLGKLLSPDYYASDFKLVEVYVNGEYFGVYILAEQQEIKKERINIDNAEDTSSNETGYLIEYDRYYEFEDEETVFELKHGSEVKDRNGEIVSEFNIENKEGYAGYTIKNDLNNVAQRDYIQNYMQTLWCDCYDAVITKTEDEAKAVIEKYIDVQSLVDTYLLQEIVCDPDLYITSFFMTLDMSASGNKKLTFQAPWDFDSTMGNKRQDANEQGLYAGVVGYDVNYQRRGTGNPWMMLLVNQPWFNDLVKTKWNKVKDSLTSTISTQISNLTNKYTTNFENNYKKWPMEPNDEYRPEAAACNTQSAAASQLGSWLTSRVVSLEKGINEFDPDLVYKAEGKYIKAYPDEDGKGIALEVLFNDGRSIPAWANLFEQTTKLRMSFYKNEEWDEDGSSDCLNTAINSGNVVKLLFPFTEAGKFYTFKFENIDGVTESIGVKAKYTNTPIGLSDFYNNSITTSTLDGLTLSTTNNMAEDVKCLLESKDLKYVNLAVDYIAGNAGYAPPLGAKWFANGIVCELNDSYIADILQYEGKYASGVYFEFRHKDTEGGKKGRLLQKWQCEKAWSTTYTLPSDVYNRMSAYSDHEGVHITFKIRNGDNFDYSWEGIKERNTGLKIKFNENNIINEAFSFLFPYVEAGKTYEFYFDGSNADSNTCSVTATHTVKPVDVNVLNDFCTSSVTSCTIEDGNYVISNNRTADVREMLIKKLGGYEEKVPKWDPEKEEYVEEIVQRYYFYTDYGFILGEKDWSNTKWIAGGEECSNIPYSYVSETREAFSKYWVSVCHKLRYSGYEWETGVVSSEEYNF